MVSLKSKTMKTLLTLSLMLLSLGIYAQGPYKSLEECKYDTLQYVAYNFEQNQSRYVGKSMQVLLDEIDIPLMTKYMIISDTGPYAGNKVRNIRLFYSIPLNSYKGIEKEVYTATISFDSSTYSYTRKEFMHKFTDEEGDIVWSEELYHFLKNYKIRKMWVNKYPMDEYRVY